MFEEYKKDQLYYELYGISYIKYIQKLIDEIIGQQESYSCDLNTLDSACKPPKSSTCHRPVIVFTPDPDTLCSTSDVITHDYNDTNKTLGFLSHGPTDYSFIGPDRQLPVSNKLEE